MFASIYGNCRRIALLTALSVGAAAVAYAAENPERPSVSASTPTVASPQAPAYFEQNDGQFPAPVKFVARMPGYTVWFTRKDVTVIAGDLKHNARVRMQLTGSGGDLIAADRLPGKVNYFLGSDPAKWHREVALYDHIIHQHAYPGIDVVYRIIEGELEYDLIVAPGANPNWIKLQFSGAKTVRIDSAGNLTLSTAVGEIHQRKPNVYQNSSSGQQALQGHFVLESRDRVGFKLAAYDRAKPLIIDPSIVYSTYLSGAAASPGASIADSVAVFTDPVTAHVYAYVAGRTCANNFPTVSALQPNFGGGCIPYGYGYGDAFVTKLDPSASGAASVVWSTYLGGSGLDAASSIAVDSAGNVYITGSTNSTNFPVRNAYEATLKATGGVLQPPGVGNAFLTKLSADGSALLYSTYFGGSENEFANGIALDSAGRAYIDGATSSPDLPTVNPFQAALRGPSDAFLAIFDTTRPGPTSLLYSTYLGGSGDLGIYFSDTAVAIAVDAAGAVHLGGFTDSSDFPIKNGLQTTPLGSGGAAFYVRLNPGALGAAQLLYSTYLGGSSDTVSAIALDSSGNAYLTGFTGGLMPTTAGAYQTVFTPGANQSPFIAKINPSQAGLASLVYSTLLPGVGQPNQASGAGIAVDANGDAFVAGYTGTGLPQINPVQNPVNGVFQSLTAGTTWTGLTQGLTDFPIEVFAVDSSTSPRTLYLGTLGGRVFASMDGGLNWNQVFQVPTVPGPSACGIGFPAPACILALAVDPTTPSNVYVGTAGAGISRSQDRGVTWSAFNAGLSSAAVQGVKGLLFDGGTLYAGAGDGLYRLNSGASTWIGTTFTADVRNIAVDAATTPHTLYTASENSGAYKSTDGGNTWTSIQSGQPMFSSITVDTSSVPSTLYAYDEPDGAMWKSTDGGSTWIFVNVSLTGSDLAATILVDDSTTPPILYVRDNGSSSAPLRSVDGGNTWTSIWSALNSSIGAIALDPTTATSTSPATLYAATGSAGYLPDLAGIAVSAFLTELNSTGSQLLFSTYLGGIVGTTVAGANPGDFIFPFGNALALDASGNMYVIGETESNFFPTVNAFQSNKSSLSAFGNGYVAGFFMKIGTQTLPQSSAGAVSTQIAVQTGTLTITLPDITGSTTNSQPTLSVTPLSSATTANFSVTDNLGAYDISTTATFSASSSSPVTLCFQAVTVNDPTTFNNLTLLHIVNGVAQNITSSYNYSTRTICGTTTSFSPFILVKGAVGQIRDLITAVNNLDLKKGIQTSLDAKLQNAVAGYSSATSHNYASVCGVMGTFMNAVQAQTGQVLTTAEAAPLLSAAQQIKATVGCP